jgi:small subunit ribosomal protein S24e
MDVKITAKKENPLMKRKEVKFTVEHLQGKTPARIEMKRLVAGALGVNEKFVFIKRMKTMTGTSIAVGFANAYESEAQAKLIEPAYILKRNNPEKPKVEAKA